MTRVEALIALRDAVRDGDPDDRLFENAFGAGSIRAVLADKAFSNGMESTGAALWLMYEVLPGWAVENWTIWPGIPSTVRIVGTHEGEDGTRWHNFKDGRVRAESDTPARALLLAILEALIAKEGEG